MDAAAFMQEALAEENARWQHPAKLTVEVKQVGARPAGELPADAPIVRAGVVIRMPSTCMVSRL